MDFRMLVSCVLVSVISVMCDVQASGCMSDVCESCGRWVCPAQARTLRDHVIGHVGDHVTHAPCLVKPENASL